MIEQIKAANAQSWDLCLKIFFITEMLKIEDTETQRKELNQAKEKLKVLEKERFNLILQMY